MLSPIEGVGRLRHRFFTPRVARHLIPALDEDGDDDEPKEGEVGVLDPDVLAILEDNPQESYYAPPPIVAQVKCLRLPFNIKSLKIHFTHSKSSLVVFKV